jgi:hypothetical protein
LRASRCRDAGRRVACVAHRAWGLRQKRALRAVRRRQRLKCRSLRRIERGAAKPALAAWAHRGALPTHRSPSWAGSMDAPLRVAAWAFWVAQMRARRARQRVQAWQPQVARALAAQGVLQRGQQAQQLHALERSLLLWFPELPLLALPAPRGLQLSAPTEPGARELPPRRVQQRGRSPERRAPMRRAPVQQPPREAELHAALRAHPRVGLRAALLDPRGALWCDA